MKIRCSSCTTVFQVAQEKLSGKKGKVKVRCPGCKTVLSVNAPRGKEPVAPDLPAELPDSRDEAVWYYAVEEQQEGPVAVGRLVELVAEGVITSESLIWKAGMSDWEPVGTVPEFSDLVFPTQAQDAQDAPPVDPSETYPDKTMEISLDDIDLPGSESSLEDELQAMARHADDGFMTDEVRFVAEEPVAEEPVAEEPVAEEPVAEEPVAEESAEDSLAKARDLLALVGLEDEEEPRPLDAPAELREDTGEMLDGLSARTPSQDEGEDLFAGFGDAPKPKPEVRTEDSLVHARRETSVLFKLDDLLTDSSRPPAASPKSAEADDSGLIDIRQVAMQSDDEDDLFSTFGSGDSSGTAAGAAPSTLAVPILKKRRVWPKIAAIAAVVMVAVAAGGLVAETLLFGVSPDDVRISLRLVVASANEELGQRKAEAESRRGQVVQELRDRERRELQEATNAQKEHLNQIRITREKELELLDSEYAVQQRAIEAQIEESRIRGEAARKEADAKIQERAIQAAIRTEGPSKKEGEKVAVSSTPESTKPGVDPRKDDRRGTQRTTDPGRKRDRERTPDRPAAKEAEKVEPKAPVEPPKEVKVAEKPPEKGGGGKEILDILDKKGGKEDGGGEGPGGGKKTLTSGDLMKGVNSRRSAMQECFNKYGGGLDTVTIRTRVTIAPSGLVTEVQISTMQFAGTALGNCVRSELSKMTFPEFSGPAVARPVSVRLP